MSKSDNIIELRLSLFVFSLKNAFLIFIAKVYLCYLSIICAFAIQLLFASLAVRGALHAVKESLLTLYSFLVS